MATTYTITVENKSGSAQDFYFFQKPAIYSGGAKVFTNSVGYGGLPAYKSGVTNQIQFTLTQQYFAGVQKQMDPPQIGVAQAGLVSQATMDLNSGSAGNLDSTTMKISGSSLYLTQPVNNPNVQEGAFRITTETFTPAAQNYNLGLSNINGDGNIVLSNFITAEPNKNVDVQPVVYFYVNTGSYDPGTVVNFTSSSVNAADCDATNGKINFKVTYTAEGKWIVS